MRLIPLVVTASIAVLTIAAVAGAGPAAWHEPGTPEGGRVYTLERGADGTVYAGTMAGLYTSPDGLTWRRGGRFPGLKEDAEVTAIVAPAETTAYAVVGGLLFKSNDTGASWQRIAHGLGDRTEVGAIAASAAQPDVVYAATSTPPRVYRSGDGGVTWSPTAYGLDEGVQAAVMVADPTTADRVYVGTANGDWNQQENGGVYMTEDAGSHWTPLSIGLPLETWVVSLAIDPSDARIVYAGTEGHGVFKSSDGGLRWRRARNGLPALEGDYATVNDLAVAAGEPRVVYAATDLGAASSVDGGASWRATTGSSPPELSSLLTDGSSPGTVLAGSLDNGVLQSSDGGEHWQSANHGLTGVSVLAIAPHPTRPATVYLGTYDGGLFGTTDGGRTWQSVAGVAARNVRAIAFDPKSHRTLYVGTVGTGVMRSADGGRTWMKASRGLAEAEGVEALAIDPRRPSTLYAATDDGVFKTVDRGVRWRRSGLAYTWVYALALDPSRPSVLYASDQHEGRFVTVSRNAGKTWKRLATGLRRGAGVRALAVARRSGVVFAIANRLDQYRLNGDVGDGAYRLERGGKRWTRIAAGLPRLPDGTLAGLRSIAIHPRTGTVHVGTNLGLYRLARTNGAWRWRLADPAFAGNTVRRIAFTRDGSRAYAALPGRFLASG